MKKLAVLAGGALASASALAALYGDTPDARHAWAVHDLNRPNPVKITAPAGLPPSDAVILFDGTKKSLDENWCDAKGQPTKWSFDAEAGAFCILPEQAAGGYKSKNRPGVIRTRKHFGDCQLHIEFRHPKGITGEAQMRGNSGIFLMNNYELQVLESFGTNPKDMKNKTYADGQCGSVYAENPPLVNPCRAPGEWQTYDIVFHQPVWKGDKLLHPGSITVFLNGVLVQDHWEMEGMTTHCKRRPLAPHEKTGPLQLQDHACPVAFRNVWYRPLASRWDNLTHSNLTADETEVIKLRRTTAKAVLAAALAETDGGKPDGWSVGRILEAYSYDPCSAEVKAAYARCADGFRARLAKMDAAAVVKAKDEIVYAKKAYDVLLRNKAIDAKDALCVVVQGLAAKNKWK